MRGIVIGLIVFVCLPGWVAAAEMTGHKDKSYIQEIDVIWNEAYGRIYTDGIVDKDVLARMTAMLELCERAVAKDPSNYEYLWRYARAAAEYAQTAQSIPDVVPGWKEVCREWGLKGFRMADKACVAHPERPEAFFWRNYCMGMYVLVGGIEPLVNAVREGFLPKSEENVLMGYKADKTYLDYIPVFARSQFLAHVPTIPFLVKGSREDRFNEAMCFHEEHNRYVRHRIQETFEWDIRATYSAEFLLDAVRVMNPDPCRKKQYLDEAREWCELGLKSPRPRYVKLCEAMLADSKKWQ